MGDYQFCRIPFGVTKGVAVFQRAMDKMVDEEGLNDTFPYLDNIAVAGRNQQEHDENVNKFHEAIQRRSLTLNETKSWNLRHLSTYLVTVWVMPSSNQTRSDFAPSRTILLQQMSALSVEWWACLFIMRRGYQTSLTRYSLLWMLHPSHWMNLPYLPLTYWRRNLRELQSLQSNDESQPFVVECDASEVCVSATLNQRGRPVAFMSRTLQGSEFHYPPVEREATAIIEAGRKWRHFLAGRHFTLVTDQRSVAFMIDNRKR